MNRAHYLLASILLFSLSPLAAVANPGALEINQDCAAVGCFAGDAPGYPVEITQPGSYILTSDLTNPGIGVNAISVSTTRVDIDLNGHTIDGGGTCSGSPVTACSGFAGMRAINISTSGPALAHIHNGSIRGFSDGAIVIFAADDGTLLEHLSVSQNGYGTLIVGNLASSTVRIRDSQFVRNLNSGITIANNGCQLLVENTSIVGNKSYGLILGSGGVAVGNRIGSNGQVGLLCSGTCALGQNTFVGNNAAAAQFTVTALSNMGGNVCLDHANSVCP